MTRIPVEVYRSTSKLQIPGRNQSMNEPSNLQYLGGETMKENDHRHEWFDAAGAGKLDDIKRLLRLGADVDWKNEQKSTALHICAVFGYSELASLLIDFNTTVDHKDENSSTALHKAASYGQKDVVQLLLDRGAQVDAKDEDSNTALHKAVFYGHKEVVDLLLHYCAPVDAKNQNFNTALHIAVTSESTEIVQILLNHNAAIDEPGEVSNSALHVAATNGFKEIVQVLLNHGAAIDKKGEDSNTALHKAALDGRSEVVKLLLDYGAEVDARDQNSDTPLHKATMLGHQEVIRTLLNYGAAVNAKDQDWNTALHKAALRGSKDVVSLLLDHKANGGAKNLRSETALHEAAKYGHKEVVSLLLGSRASANEEVQTRDPIRREVSDMGDAQMNHLPLDHGVDIEALDLQGQTTFMVAAKAGQQDMVTLLIENGANIETTDNDSLTALHWSAKEGNRDVLELLLQHNANIEATTRHGDTALHIAAEFNHHEVITILLRYGARFEAENLDRNTPIQVAIMNGHCEIVDCLKNAGTTKKMDGYTDLDILYLAADASQVQLVKAALRRNNDAKETAYLKNATLRRASQQGQVDVVTHLLDIGADLEECDDEGLTPLFLAGQHPETISILLHYGACMERRNIKNRNQSLLHHFSLLGHFEALWILLHCGCNIHSLDDDDNTALHYASKSGECDIASLLLEHGVDINSKNVNGQTALHIAVDYGFPDLTTMLIDEGIDIDAKDCPQEQTALHIAIIKCNTELVSLLLNRRANVNAKDRDGNTALHIAASYNRTEECCLIIKHGANVNLMDKKKRTPLHYATLLWNPSLVKLLLDYGASVHISDHGSRLLDTTIKALMLEKGYFYESKLISIITLFIEANADTTGLQLSDQFKGKFPELVNALTKATNQSTSRMKDLSNLSSVVSGEDASNLNQTDIVLREYIVDSDNRYKNRRCEERRLMKIKHKYGYGFPLSKRLQLDNLPNVNETDGHGTSARTGPYFRSLKLFDALSINERAITLIQTLFNCFGVKLFTSEYFFVIESERYAGTTPTKLASHFDKMQGVIREPGRLILQIPSKQTCLSIPAWHKSTHSYLQFIDAMYVCRKSSSNMNSEIFSDVLGGSERTLANDLHAILIAGLSILAIAGGDGAVENLVMAILGVKLDLTQNISSKEVLGDWQIRNRRQCSCNNDSVHRPLSPVAAAKAVGIDIWRERPKQTLKRVWDLQQDKLVKGIDATEVIFITHRWTAEEVEYHDVEKMKRWKSHSISKRSEKLYRIRKALLRRHAKYVWIDTICIDKSNLSELDEAIRSMYKWYASCAAVILDSGTPLNVWCKRGWCLQEGAAAGLLYGISKEGKLVTIQELAIEQHQSLCTLDLHLYYRPGNAAEIVTRMNVRETTRSEDMVYALIGILSIHLPLAYGEGIKSRERLFHTLANQIGDLSFLSYKTTQKMSQTCLPTISEPNYLIAKCIKATVPIMVSHVGICFEVQLIKGQEISRILHKLLRWRDMSFAKGRFYGVDELIEAEKKSKDQSASSIELAVVRHIRSLILVETYNEELQTYGRPPIKLRYRLQCCQIEEHEFNRLFGRIDAEVENIWLGDQPDGAEVDQFESGWSGRRGKQSIDIEKHRVSDCMH